ncbi:hypothetical protein HMPREF3120_00450 [Corynebacterium sp. HMSC11D10]|uniref:ABC-three component system middle component 2 n=1 Tax=Corynebacterium sp. HMSC11D10 TaxID=1581088 RepID=UPI0008A3706A|nr:ABC-three component system middle component 2 [Corynebacterium sp. HMSC11D10]OFU58318.1 hypothetical protein HMPREF3120_00450 [Corynebacterium sp. HMSC11D10]
MDKVFNGPLEVGLRVLVILGEAFPSTLDVSRLVIYDHIILHSDDFGGPASLVPPLPIRVGELGPKRQRIKGGLQLLIRADLVSVGLSRSGIEYGATDRAEPFLKLLESPYTQKLRDRASWARQKVDLSEEENLRRQMGQISDHWVEEFELYETWGETPWNV